MLGIAQILFGDPDSSQLSFLFHSQEQGNRYFSCGRILSSRNRVQVQDIDAIRAQGLESLFDARPQSRSGADEAEAARNPRRRLIGSTRSRKNNGSRSQMDLRRKQHAFARTGKTVPEELVNFAAANSSAVE